MKTTTDPVSPSNELWQLYLQGDTSDVLRRMRPVEQLLIDDGMPTAETAADLELLGVIRHDEGRIDEAADAIEKAGLVIQLSDTSRIALSSCYAELGKIDLARELYLQLALSRRLSPDMMLQVAAGLEAVDSPQLAMMVCEWITERDDSVARAYYDMGLYSARSGNPLYITEALTHRALQLDPGNVHYRVGLVSLLIQLDREDEAEIALGSINTDQIATVNCRSCLGRIASLLRRCGDDVRASACDGRLEELANASNPDVAGRTEESGAWGAQ